MIKYSEIKLKPYIHEALDSLGFVNATKVQELTIPKALDGKSVMVESATGSGKTHSFLIPIFQNLDESLSECQAVIIAPTRELAQQLYENAEAIAKFSKTKIRVAKVIGGGDRQNELKKYEENTPQIIVGTIGRIHDLAITSNALKIHNAKMIVIDEADMIFEEKEIVEVDHIMAKFINLPQFLIFSATISKGLRAFLNQYFNNIERVILEEKSLTKTNIQHLMLQCKAKAKLDVLLDLLKVINPYLSIIFVNTKEAVEELALELAKNGYSVGKLHGDMNDRERKQMLRRIKDLEFKYIVASDIAARGIDIEGVTHVINFDLPKEIEFYIHRSGRTARFDREGIAISLYAYEDDKYVKDLRNKGLIVKFVKLSNGELVETKMERKVVHKSFVKKIEEEVHASVPMPKKVKPGYKKKRKAEIDKQIRKKKREHIEEIYRNKARRERAKK